MAASRRLVRPGRAGGPWGWMPVWLLGLALAGCGGGGDASGLVLTMPADLVTTLDRVTIGGTVSLPAGSERAGGTPTMPIVTCQLGTHTMQWSNAANGSSGRAVVAWDCPKDIASWTAIGIPLAPGPNAVTVSISDASQRAQGTVTITRQ